MTLCSFCTVRADLEFCTAPSKLYTVNFFQILGLGGGDGDGDLGMGVGMEIRGWGWGRAKLKGEGVGRPFLVTLYSFENIEGLIFPCFSLLPS